MGMKICGNHAMNPLRCQVKALARRGFYSKQETSKIFSLQGLFVAISGHREAGSMNLVRMIIWTIALAYCGSFLFAGRGVRSLHNVSISGAFIGAVLGLLIAIMFIRRARRKHI